MNSIRLQFENRQNLPVDENWIAQRTREAIAEESSGPVDLVVALVDDAAIREINRQFLDHDWATDVISFSYGEDGGSRGIDGELVVSVETGMREAAAHGWCLEAELLLYVLHGFLHLCGYDDLTDEDRPAMRRRERELMARFGYIPQDLQS